MNSKELTIAKEAAYAAADVIQEYQTQQSFEVDFKGRNDMVTSADKKAEETIIDCIKETFPEDKIVAEESAQSTAGIQDRAWIIDPIDGTTNFVHGYPLYCVSVAFWADEKPQAGVVLEVNNGELFYAVNGEGAFLNDNEIQVSKVPDPQNAMIGTGFPYDKKSYEGDYLRLFKHMLHNTQSVRRPGTAAYDLCCVACGRYDGFYENPLHPWDIGAAALIVQEAGGVVTDWQGSSNWLLSGDLVAANPDIHPFMLDAINMHYIERLG